MPNKTDLRSQLAALHGTVREGQKVQANYLLHRSQAGESDTGKN